MVLYLPYRICQSLREHTHRCHLQQNVRKRKRIIKRIEDGDEGDDEGE